MSDFPAVRPLAGLPASVSVYEVGPRDGLQAEATVLPTPTKIEFVERLQRCGLTAIETTSFVSPRRVPQLADAEQVLSGIERRDGVRYPVLVPNLRGLDRALGAGAREIAVFVSATERFAAENLGTTRDGAIDLAAPVVRRAVELGIGVRGYVSMCFGDPWEGAVPLVDVIEVIARLVELGCRRISLGDTIGVATAGQVRELCAAVVDAGIGLDRIALHFHDTYGQALTNVLAGLQAGVSEFDSAAGGLGGCPFARSATGNLATEDLVWMLTGLGYDLGIDLGALVTTSRWLAERLGRPAPSRVVGALGSN